LKTTFYNVQ